MLADFYNTLLIKFSDKLVIKSLQSLVIVITLLVLQAIFRRGINKFMTNHDVKHRWKKISRYVTLILSAIFIAPLWLKEAQSFATFFGLFTAGIAISLKDSLSNIAAWFYIFFYKPFKHGDRIEIKGMSGDIIDIDMFQITMLEIGNWVDSDQSTGRIIHMPTSFVFSESLFNYTKGFNWIWNEMSLMVTFESNWEKCKGILDQIINEYEDTSKDKLIKAMKKAKRDFLVSYDNIEPIVYLSVKESGVHFTIRYFCEPKQRRVSENELWQRILTAFKKETDIEFAYPTTRFYDRAASPGKQAK